MTTATKKIPSGYKQTEIGVIPVDWDIKSLGLECDLITKGTTPTSIGCRFQDSGIYFIKIEAINDKGGIELDKIAFINGEAHKLLKRSQLLNGDILFSIAGALGRVAIVGEDIIPANTNQALAIIRLRINSEFDKKYVYYFLNSKAIKKHFESISVQGAQVNLSLQNIYDLPIGYSKIKSEQAAIATALSDIDELIDKLGKLIEKKKNIKQGAMQELLTGKKRLHDFNGEWITKTIGEICKYQNGTSLEKYFGDSDGYKVISIGNYSTVGKYVENEMYIGFGFVDLIKKYILNKDDLTMILNDKTSTGEIIGRVLLIDEDNKYVFNQRTMRLTPLDAILSKYLYFLINSGDVHKKLASQAKPGTQIYFNTADILNFKIIFPKDKPEQTAIIEALADMDIEIEKLESQLTKYQNLKQGMVQTLLTGKIRLN